MSAGFGLTPSTALPGAPGGEAKLSELLSGCREDAPFWKRRRDSGCHDIFFLSPMSKTAELTAVMAAEAAGYKFPGEKLGVTLQPQVQGRGCHVEFSLFFEGDDTRESAAAQALFKDVPPILMKHGAYFGRPYGAWADMVYSECPETVEALTRLKDIFDPEHILNPGKLCFKAVTYGQPE